MRALTVTPEELAAKLAEAMYPVKYISHDPQYEAQADLATRVFRHWLSGLALSVIMEFTKES